MNSVIALLRAVNVGGTGKLPMSDLKIICERAGFASVRTYIASGNVVFRSPLAEDAVKRVMSAALETYAGKPMGVLIRSDAEMAEIVRRNPFPAMPLNQVIVTFLDEATGPSTLDGVTGQDGGELINLGRREIYTYYPLGAGHSKLRIPAAKGGTGRNINTAVKLAEMAAKC